ncbi:MAG: tetratricopeptide repeat protein, partial [Deltaproteobacteria bacterium]|nr:tetratricopeptide repeat protein [Deltaproteobacteria bacterium]
RYAQALTLEGEILDDLGRHASAATVIARSCDIIAFETGDDSTALAQCWMSQTSALLGLGKKAEALALVDKAVPLMLAAYGQAHPLVATALVLRGIVHARLRHRAFAAADLEKAIRILEAVPYDPSLLDEARRQLARVSMGRASSHRASSDPR